MARGNQDLLVKKNSKLESFLKRAITEEKYERIRAYESCIVVSEKDNKSFKFVILGDDSIFLAENPPKAIQEAVHLKDVISVELVNDYPEFLSGSERENTQHLAITHLTSEARRRSFRRSKKSQRNGSLTELNIDRSEVSTPVSCTSSLDGSEDYGYVTNSSTSRPNSRNSVSSSRDTRNGHTKKKKKPMSLNDSLEHDSILQSLKEEIEDQVEEIEEDRLSTIQTGSRTLNNIDRDSVCTSQTSVRQLPPNPRKGAFETSEPPAKNGSLEKEDDEIQTGCCFVKLWKKFRKNRINPGVKTENSYRPKSNLSKSESVNEIRKPPDISIERQATLIQPSSPAPSFHLLQHGIRRSSDVSTGRGSRLSTPGERHRSTSGLASEFGGSITGLHLLSADAITDKRKTVLHIYLLNLTSPILMLVRSAWSNYLIRSTLQIETINDIHQKSAVIRASQNLREKTDLLFHQLKRELLNPKNNIDDNYRLMNELKVATEKNFILKKLFWRNSDMFLFLVRNLQKYLPKSAVNLDSIDGRRERVDEFEIVILMAEILSLMFRESEIIPDRIQTLKAERGKAVLDMLMTLTCLPEIPNKSSKLSKIKPTDEEFTKLLDEYTQVSVTAVFELFLMARQASWGYTEDNFFNISWMVRILEDYRTTEKFVDRVIRQVLDVMGPSQYDTLSPEESICLYQHFTVLLTFLEYSPRVTAFIYNSYIEEFKYYIHHKNVAKKLPSSFPITQMTLNIADAVINKVRNAGNTLNKTPR
ncbi:hypothetical protein SNE40_015764 [Patella caerulea]|uniref:Uncharacterized protein n=1 Tax=Patella caerulea TaxID=87958 RepID=A0AAN8PM06_PATCE